MIDSECWKASFNLKREIDTKKVLICSIINYILVPFDKQTGMQHISNLNDIIVRNILIGIGKVAIINEGASKYLIYL